MQIQQYFMKQKKGKEEIGKIRCERYILILSLRGKFVSANQRV